jgi:hypothetical protein
MDFKSTDRMDPHELNAIVRQAVRSPVPLPPPPPIPWLRAKPEAQSAHFVTEPPTMPDENWVVRHVARATTRQWRTIQLTLFILLVGLILVIAWRW